MHNLFNIVDRSTGSDLVEFEVLLVFQSDLFLTYYGSVLSNAIAERHLCVCLNMSWNGECRQSQQNGRQEPGVSLFQELFQRVGTYTALVEWYNTLIE